MLCFHQRIPDNIWCIIKYYWKYKKNMNKYLYGKSAIVTGASSGIGREIAITLAQEGVNVLAVARRKDRLHNLETLSKNFVGKIFPFSTDLRDRNSHLAIVSKAITLFGKIDLLINDAGVGNNAKFESIKVSTIDKIIQTNLMAPIFLTKEVLPLMLKRQSGHIVFVSSLAGKLGFPELSVYSASKFAIEGLAESIRREIGNRNVAVTLLRPGVTDTEFFEKANMKNYYINAKKENRLHSPSSVATELLNEIHKKPNAIVVGSDKWYLRLLPFIPEKYCFKVLDLFK